MRYIGQIGVTLASAMTVTLVWLATGYRGPANLVAMLVPPIVIGLAANESRGRGAFMALALTILHLVAVSIFGVLVVGY